MTWPDIMCDTWHCDFPCTKGSATVRNMLLHRRELFAGAFRGDDNEILRGRVLSSSTTIYGDNVRKGGELCRVDKFCALIR